MNSIVEITPTNPLVQYPDDLLPPLTLIQNGWSPQIANVLRTNVDGTKDVIQKVTDWFGGLGTKPTTDLYVSDQGFTSNILIATPISNNSVQTPSDETFEIV